MVLAKMGSTSTSCACKMCHLVFKTVSKSLMVKLKIYFDDANETFNTKFTQKNIPVMSANFHTESQNKDMLSGLPFKDSFLVNKSNLLKCFQECLQVVSPHFSFYIVNFISLTVKYYI